jgi:hypothetical protein
MGLLLLMNQVGYKNGGAAVTQTIFFFFYSQHVSAQTGHP